LVAQSSNAAIEALTILVDHDKPDPKTGKRAGGDAALELIRRYTEAGSTRSAISR
jgi:hypothetical protein